MIQSYEPLLALFQAHLENYKSGLKALEPVELYAPENYILGLGGKRIRPLLSLIACDLFDAPPQRALNAALCVELFHNFSLIHDDILDQAPLRRNQPTVHHKWNTNIAILSGDVMLVKAFDVLQNEPTEQLIPLWKVFTKTAIEVCEGQQWDMNFEQEIEVSVEAYIKMITYKTAVLLGCSLRMGAICAGADETAQEAIYHFGKHLGIAFQLLDDKLDAFAEDTEAFGKQTGGDIISNKKTFLLLKAFEMANTGQRKRLQEALRIQADRAAEKVQLVKAIYSELGIEQLVQQEADLHTSKAVAYLHDLKVDAGKRKQLEQFAIALLNRSV